MTEFHHISVLLEECLEGLNIKPDGIYVDGTLGGAGHSSQIAKRLTTGRLIGIDRDMGTVILLGVKPGIVAAGIFKRQIGVLNVVLAESDQISVDTDLIEIDFLLFLVFGDILFQVAVS